MNWNEPAPGEREAQERAWPVVQSAWSAREPAERRRTVRVWPTIALAAVAVVAAAVVTSPGRAVLGSLRDAVREQPDKLTSLPSGGRLLVQGPAGAWVVHSDGSKRYLRNYLNASWSPGGLYIAAARGNELVAMEPNGNVHWTLARPAPVGGPRWSWEGYRIAYLSGHALRIVNGDSTGDHEVTPNAVGPGLSAFDWRPRTHQLAYKNAHDVLVLLDADRSRILWRRPTRGIEQLIWSDDGRRLLVVSNPSFIVDARGRTVATLRGVTPPFAFEPHTHHLAATTRGAVVVLGGVRYDRRLVVFHAAGAFDGIEWSPDARWLLVDWSSADEWVFIRSASVRRIRAIPNISAIFGAGPEAGVSLAGWCCPKPRATLRTSPTEGG
jgi:hypothetical protein